MNILHMKYAVEVAKLGQVISGLKELGFFTVVEAALGADIFYG